MTLISRISWDAKKFLRKNEANECMSKVKRRIHANYQVRKERCWVPLNTQFLSEAIEQLHNPIELFLWNSQRWHRHVRDTLRHVKKVHAIFMFAGALIKCSIFTDRQCHGDQLICRRHNFIVGCVHSNWIGIILTDFAWNCGKLVLINENVGRCGIPFKLIHIENIPTN